MEKYRPQKLSEVVGNEDAVQRLRSIAQDGNMPHMILTVRARGHPKSLPVARLSLQLHGGISPAPALTTWGVQGSPGIGKTTCVMALAREMLGDAVKDGVLELNASDERGIDVVRGKIKMFAQHKVRFAHEDCNLHVLPLKLSQRRHSTMAVPSPLLHLRLLNQVTLPPGKHKIVILDEADSMTAAAQQAMRRTMELYSSTTRFALACNNSSGNLDSIYV